MCYLQIIIYLFIYLLSIISHPYEFISLKDNTCLVLSDF